MAMAVRTCGRWSGNGIGAVRGAPAAVAMEAAALGVVRHPRGGVAEGCMGRRPGRQHYGAGRAWPVRGDGDARAVAGAAKRRWGQERGPGRRGTEAHRGNAGARVAAAGKGGVPLRLDR